MRLPLMAAGMMLMGSVLAFSLSLAAESTPFSSEVLYLLDRLERSDCRFQRNGSWYDSKQARAHLQQKYDYLQRKGLVRRTEDFIEKGAASSSTSGQPYQVKCADLPTVTSERWLTDELARYRAKK